MLLHKSIKQYHLPANLLFVHLVDAQHGEMGQYVINNDITCINRLWVSYVCCLVIWWVWPFRISSTITDCSELPRLCGLVDPTELINPSQSNQCVEVWASLSVTLIDVEPVTGVHDERSFGRRAYYYQRTKHIWCISASLPSTPINYYDWLSAFLWNYRSLVDKLKTV